MVERDQEALTRRQLLLGVAGAGALAAGCSGGGSHAATPTTTRNGAPVAPDGGASTVATTAVGGVAGAGTAGGLAAYVPSGPTTGRSVALTFHGSGEVGLVQQLLDEAKQEQCPITVFVVGQWLMANPAVGRRMVADGHELANHTFTHPTLSRLGQSAVATEITGCRDALAHVVGTPGRWFRPSGVEARPSDLILRQSAAAGYPTVIGFDVDPMDYKDPGADAVASRAIAGLHAGAIVSLHTGHAGTVAALPRIVAAVRSRGLQPVTVSDLVGPARP